MSKKLIYGIQQIGIGVENAKQLFEWYATRLAFDVPIFEDNNEATLMAPYMGGTSHKKKAILAMNMQGGSGCEIWQYLDKKPVKPAKEIELGDLGINCIFVKTIDIKKTFERLKKWNENIISELLTEPDSLLSFYLKDPANNLIKIKENRSLFDNQGKDNGGIFGCTIGVSDIDQSLTLYSTILGYDQVIYDRSGIFEDFNHFQKGNESFRRVLLTHNKERTGGFSPLLGSSQIELIQALDSKPIKIFKDRFWGDLGFIHIAFDVRNIQAMTQECKDKGYPFKVLSDESFDMGETNAQWGYFEDNDGTLIEVVETHKVPLFKPLGLNIDLKKRAPLKPLPRWMIKGLNLKRVKKFK